MFLWVSTAKPKSVIIKQKGDIAEQAIILKALQLGFGVCKPIGDRMPCDLVFDVGGHLLRIQVKSAWYDESRGNYVIDTRRTKTNQRHMLRSTYSPVDFDFAIAFIEALGVFYIIPVNCFISHGSEIHLVEVEKRQRLPKSATYREAWGLINNQLVSSVSDS